METMLASIMRSEKSENGWDATRIVLAILALVPLGSAIAVLAF